MTLQPRTATVCSFLEYIVIYLWFLYVFLTLTMAASEESTFNVVGRYDWGAKPYRLYPKIELLKHPVPYVVVSYFTPDITDDKLALQVIQEKHMNSGLPDIQANFLVGKNGTIYEGRGWCLKPPKSLDFPTFDGKYIEISYIGNFNDEPVHHPIYKATWEILEYGKQHKFISDNFVVLTEKDKYKALNK